MNLTLTYRFGQCSQTWPLTETDETRNKERQNERKRRTTPDIVSLIIVRWHRPFVYASYRLVWELVAVVVADDVVLMLDISLGMGANLPRSTSRDQLIDNGRNTSQRQTNLTLYTLDLLRKASANTISIFPFASLSACGLASLFFLSLSHEFLYIYPLVDD